MNWPAFLVAFAVFLPLLILFSWWAVVGIVVFLAIMLCGVSAYLKSHPL